MNEKLGKTNQIHHEKPERDSTNQHETLETRILSNLLM